MDKWNLIKLYNLSQNKTDLNHYLHHNGILESTKKCPNCGESMTLSLDGVRFRCQKYISTKNKGKVKCQTQVSAKKNSWFSRSNLDNGQVLMLTYMILRNYQAQDIMRELSFASHTVSDWTAYTRQVLEDWTLEKSEVIGGPGKHVEIDESKFGKRKYHRGHHVEGQWVFGGLERETGRIFLVAVPNRTRETLTQIIKEWINPGTTIISDCWKAYENLGKEGYNHLTVNHSLNFVDPISGAHTNAIESTWRHAKRFLPHYNRRNKNFPGYLSHYMFMKKCKSENTDELSEFLKYASHIDFDASTLNTPA